MNDEHSPRRQEGDGTGGFSRLAVAGAALIILQTLTTAGSAQINPFGRPGAPRTTDLSQEDMDRMNTAAASLREDESTPIGTSKTWQNPNSGASGTVTLLQRYQRQDMSCRKLRHDFRDIKAHASSFVFDICRTPGGEWKIAN
jgi:surface antigen